jgi:hypothetical protein
MGSAIFEPLEQRRMLSASPVYAPHAKVEGQSLQHWAEDWWQKVFATPIYAADGKTIIHPQFDTTLGNPGEVLKAPHALPSEDGEVTYLFGSFFGGPIDRTVTVPANKPIFVPVLNTEWSNPDTAAKPTFTTYPGNYTPKELADYAKLEASLVTGLGATLDGKAIADVAAHREPALRIKLKESGPYSIHNVFFGDAPTKAFDAATDGYYLMLKPLAVGDHVLHFVGTLPDRSSTPPLLGGFTTDMTYHIKVVAPPRHGHGNECLHATASSDSESPFNSDKQIADEVCA